MRAIELRDRIRDMARDASNGAHDARTELAAAQQQLLETEHALADAYTRMVEAQLSEPDAITQQRVKTALAERRSAEAELHKNLAHREQKIAEGVEATRTLDAKITQARESISASLKSDAAFVSAATAASEAADQLAKIERDAGELRDEVEGKRQAYANDHFLAYLRNRGYGAPEYGGTGILARFDAWLAEKTNFAVNLANMETLDGMARVIEDKLTTARQQAEETAAALAKLTEKAEADAGITELKKQRDDIVKDSEQYRKAALEDKAELEKYAQGTDTYSQRVREYLERTLEEADGTELEAIAAATATKDDDALVPVIKQLRGQRAEQRQLVASLTKSQRERERERDRARELEREFESNSYGSRRYRYDDSMDVSGILTGYMLGRMSSPSDALGSMRQYRRDEPSYSGSSSSSSSSRSSSSDDGGGWSFSSGGGSSSSDFSTSSFSDSGSFSTSDSC